VGCGGGGGGGRRGCGDCVVASARRVVSVHIAKALQQSKRKRPQKKTKARRLRLLTDQHHQRSRVEAAVARAGALRKEVSLAGHVHAPLDEHDGGEQEACPLGAVEAGDDLEDVRGDAAGVVDQGLGLGGVGRGWVVWWGRVGLSGGGEGRGG